MLEGLVSRPDRSKTLAIPKINLEDHPNSASRLNCPPLQANSLIFSNSDHAHAISVCESVGLEIVNREGGFTGICPRSKDCGRLEVEIGKIS